MDRADQNACVRSQLISYGLRKYSRGAGLHRKAAAWPRFIVEMFRRVRSERHLGTGPDFLIPGAKNSAADPLRLRCRVLAGAVPPSAISTVHRFGRSVVSVILAHGQRDLSKMM